MPTYNGWNIISMPGTPSAPASIEVMRVDAVAENVSPFTFQQQIQNWNANRQELSVILAPLSYADAQPWLTFLIALQGVANVFQFGSSFCAAYPVELSGGSPPGPLYWRLKSNSRKWSVADDRYYRIAFEVVQAQ